MAPPISHVLTGARRRGATIALTCFFVRKTLNISDNLEYSILPEYNVGFSSEIILFPREDAVKMANIFMTD